MSKIAARICPGLALLFLFVRSAACEPFDLRGFRLGITLQQFKVTPFPDSDYESLQIICADRRSDSYLVNISRKDAEAGVIRCIHYGKWQAIGGMDIHAQLDVAGTKVPFNFDFWTKSATESRLFRISSEFTNQHWDDLLMAYTARYKEPASVRRSTVQNALGAKFLSTTVQWNRDGSSIVLMSRTSRLDWMRLLYQLNALQADYEATLRKIIGSGKL